MPLKDHYRTLGVATHATAQQIKKAYRTLAHQYHPDKNPDNVLAEHHFREIQEAYAILSDERARKHYDEERYFSGLSAQREPAQITGEWLLQQAKKLSKHMLQVDSYRMNHSALHDYVSLLLSESHLAVLEQEREPLIREQILVEVLSATKGMNFPYFEPLVLRLRQLAGSNDKLTMLLEHAVDDRRRAARLRHWLPLLVLLATIVLCVIMYLYSR